MNREAAAGQNALSALLIVNPVLDLTAASRSVLGVFMVSSAALAAQKQAATAKPPVLCSNPPCTAL